VKRPKTVRDGGLDSWRRAVAHEQGPAGIHLLAELLNWDAERVKSIEPKAFKEDDNRRRIIERIQGELRMEQVREANRQKKKVARLRSPLDWRPKWLEIHAELKGDVLSIIEPQPLSENELSKRYIGIQPGIHKVLSARENRFKLLWHKLRSFNWPMVGILIHGRGGLYIGIEGENRLPTIAFEIDGEKIEMYERWPIFRGGLREHLYFVLFCALRNNEFSKLRMCSLSSCQKFFIPQRHGKHCSETCRTRDSNQMRIKNKDFRKYYDQRKQERIAKAKRLLRLGKSVQDILEQIPELTRKALERDAETAKLLAKTERSVEW
jgi:hypothetical protein